MNDFYLGQALRLPRFFFKGKLLGLGLLLLLCLAHTLQFLVDLLRRLDAIGRLLLGAVVRIRSI